MTYIVAGIQADGSKLWAPVDTIEAAFILGSVWRASGTHDITVAAVVPYTAKVVITAGGQTLELPIPDVPGA